MRMSVSHSVRPAARSAKASAERWLLRLAPALALALLPLSLTAQQPAQSNGSANWADEVLAKEGYTTPPPALADAVLIQRYLNVSLSNASPDKQWFLDEIGDGPVLMKTFSKPYHELGGVFVDFKANRARALTTRNNIGIQIISAADGSKKAIQIPPGARVSNAAWSPDGKSVAYFVHTDDATHIWMTDIATNTPRQITKTPVLATLSSVFEFTADGKSIATVIIPDGRAPMPVEPASPPGPVVKIADSDKNRLRTFPSLMTTPYQKTLLEWHATGQVALIDVATRTVKKVGQPAMVRSIDASPDGKYIRVTRMVKPFSYDVPVGNFGSIEEIWDAADGKALVKLNERPINMGVQDDQPPVDPQAPPAAPGAGGGRGGNQNQTGRRELAWRHDGQGLTYLEQEPPPPGSTDAAGGRGARGARGGGGGAAATPDDPSPDAPQGARQTAAPRKDRLVQWLPPFNDGSKKVLLESNTRMTGHRFSPDMQTVFFSERAGQNTIEYAVALAEPAKRYTLARYRADDIYANPGSIAMVRGAGGGGGRGAGGGGRGGGVGGPGGGIVLLSADKESVFFQGTAYDRSPQQTGPKTFIDRVAIKTGEKKRIYESDNNNAFERVSTIVDPDAARFIVARETPTEVPQNYLVEGGKRVQLTQNKDYTPDLTHAVRQQFAVERPDGFKFRVKVTLPQNYQTGTRLPALFWFYPREFTTQDEYDRPDRTFNKNTFPNFGTRSVEFFVRQGYAVVEPDTPIVGAQGQMNNNYVNDLRNDLAATIDELDRRQLVDRSRLAIGGHSYGAFSTVNAMVHTPFFKAGIAGDGAYNRTLTPIGFQSERRDLWEARDVYLSMSPFLYANNLSGALLMYHNLADQNVGTDPTNSIRLYHALNGLGKTTALYMYPYEDHGPVAKETLLDLWARWAAWLDKYVKNPTGAKSEKKITTSSSQGR
jgi:dipeptidyl aminopeptidase/acylaminoacyl peptidase